MLSAHLHAFSHGDCARRLRLWLTFDFDETSAASGNWLEEWVIAKTWNLHTDLFSGANDESALWHLHLDTVDRDVDEFYWSVGHANQPFALTKTVEDSGLKA